MSRGKHVKIGNKIFGKFNNEPAVALVIAEYIPVEKIIEYNKNGVSLLEIRFDLLGDPFDKVIAYVKEIKEKTDLPLIGTLRETDYNKTKRVEFFERLIPVVDAVDIEIEAEIAQEVSNIADKNAKVVIVSEHNFDNMPDEAGLDKIVKESLTLGADIVKIAAVSNSLEESARLMNYTYKSEIPMVAIAMGDAGKITRMGAMFFGSLYTYTFISKSVVPGQINFTELMGDIKKYYPESN